MKKLLLSGGLLLLFLTEILRVYFIMPFPGSQRHDTISLAYWLNNNITWIRVLALALLIIPLIAVYSHGKNWIKIAVSLTLALYAIVFFFFNYRFEADRMFYQPRHKLFAAASADTTQRSKLVIGVFMNGQARAYPVEIIGYHHQVIDTVGNTAMIVTYCTVCRTGRVFSPFVNGKMESFRLVGMDNFNAMLEDVTTKSWWQQATGLAIAGPLKGAALKELPSMQMALGAWLRQYPDSYVMQPDTIFNKQYQELRGYDRGTVQSVLEKRDSTSWKPKSWVIGVLNGQSSKAYDWNELVTKKVINDSFSGLPLVVVVETDTASFHVYDRRVNGTTLAFEKGTDNVFTDEPTRSTWGMDGLCISGTLKGQRLRPIQSYQEFWHSWGTFHPRSAIYAADKK